MKGADEAPGGGVVRLRGVRRIYGEGPGAVPALDGVDLDVERGERVAVIGPSGSGKSTLLHIVGGMDLPDEGSVIVAGMDLLRLSDEAAARFRRLEVGFVFQFFNLVGTLSALDNVALPARLAGLPVAEARDRAGRLLERVGLGGRLDSPPDAMSGGQQQRVAIARALVNGPGIVLADEPTGALDSATGEAVLSLLGEIVRERGATLLMGTHSADVVSFASRVVRIEDGRIVDDGRRES